MLRSLLPAIRGLSSSSSLGLNSVPRTKTSFSNQFRGLQTGLAVRHDDSLKDLPETLTVHFEMKDGSVKSVGAKVGERALYLAHRHGIDMEVGRIQ